MNRYQLSLHDRFQPYFWRRLARVAVAVSVAFVLALAVFTWDNHEQVVDSAQARISQAEADRQEVLDVLSGRLAMVEPVGEGYAKFATVRWSDVEKME